MITSSREVFTLMPVDRMSSRGEMLNFPRQEMMTPRREILNSPRQEMMSPRQEMMSPRQEMFNLTREDEIPSYLLEFPNSRPFISSYERLGGF
jgi:hypothetical protein